MPGDAVATAATLSPRPIACSALQACGLTLTAAPISPKAAAASKTSACIPQVLSACAAASPASPPPTIAILQLPDIRPSAHVSGIRTGPHGSLLEMLSFSHENQLERCPQVSVRGVFCYSRRELVFFSAWHERSFSFLRIFSNDTGILILSRLHTFRPVSDLLLFRVHQKMIRPPRAGANHASGLVTAPSAGRCHNHLTNAATCARWPLF